MCMSDCFKTGDLGLFRPFDSLQSTVSRFALFFTAAERESNLRPRKTLSQ
jgi:hypothetical protein